jgi:ATP-dependent exoDNAse (exonuclease V) alpha subunit
MYEKNDVVKFINSYKNGIEKGELYKVISCNNVGNRITLKKGNKEFVFSLRKNVNYEDKIEVFEKNNLDLQVGLKIIFTKNNKKEGLVNSESAKIEKINQDSITFKMENGDTKTIKKEELKHMNYGYCSTVHSAQGKTYDKSIAAIGDNKMLTTQKSWCVILSRHKENFTAIVHDKNKMKTYTISNSGTEMSAIELEQKQDKQNDITNTKSQNIKVNNAIEMSIG